MMVNTMVRCPRNAHAIIFYKNYNLYLLVFLSSLIPHKFVICVRVHLFINVSVIVKPYTFCSAKAQSMAKAQQTLQMTCEYCDTAYYSTIYNNLYMCDLFDS